MQGAVHIPSTRCSQRNTMNIKYTMPGTCVWVLRGLLCLSQSEILSHLRHTLFVLFSGIQPHCASVRNTVCEAQYIREQHSTGGYYSVSSDPYTCCKEKYQIKQENIQFDISESDGLIRYKHKRMTWLPTETKTCSPPHVDCIIWWEICGSAGWINSVWLKCP